MARYLVIGLVLAAALALLALLQLGGGLDDRFAGQHATQAGAAPGPPPPPEDAATATLRAEAAHVTEGTIRYNPASQMQVGRAEIVEIRIGRADVAQKLAERMAGRGQPVSEAVAVGHFMRVLLRGGAAFRIDPEGAQDRAIPDGGIGDWIFHVTPLQAGPQSLELYVFVRVKLPGGDELISQPVLRREIAVAVNYWWDIAELWRAEWKWFLGGLGAIVMAVGGYLLKRWWERRPGA